MGLEAETVDLTPGFPYTSPIGGESGMSGTVANAGDRLGWMQDGLKRQSERNIQSELRSTRERLAEMCLEKYGPEFLGNVLHWLKHYAGTLSDIGMSGWVTEVCSPAQGEQIYQVHARTTFPLYKGTHSTVQFGLPNGRLITCRGLEGDFRRVDLVVLPSEEGVGASWTDKIMPMSAKEAASELIREIVNRIDSEAW